MLRCSRTLCCSKYVRVGISVSRYRNFNCSAVRSQNKTAAPRNNAYSRSKTLPISFEGKHLINVESYAFCKTLLSGANNAESAVSNILDHVEKELRFLNHPVLFRNVQERHKKGLLKSVSQVLNQKNLIVKCVQLACLVLTQEREVSNSTLYTRALEQCIIFKCKEEARSLLQLDAAENCEPSLLIEAYGLINEVEKADNIFRNIKDGEGSDDKFYGSYKAVVGAYLNNVGKLKALTLFEKLRNDQHVGTNPKFGDVLEHLVKGFIETDDFDAAWKWIVESEADPKLRPISGESLVRLFSRMCTKGSDYEAISKLFNYMAARKDISSTLLFNTTRSDFITFCVNGNRVDGVQKLVKEAQLRNGVWDHSTLVLVVKYLLLRGNIDVAVHTFLTQSRRLSLEDNFEELNNEAVTEIFNDGFLAHSLKSSMAVKLINSDLLPYCGKQIALNIWKSMGSIVINDDIHCVAPFLNNLMFSSGRAIVEKDYLKCINNIIEIGLPVSFGLFSTVNDCLKKLQFENLQKEWENVRVDKTACPVVDYKVSDVIIGFCQTQDGELLALQHFEDAMRRRTMVTFGAITTLFETEHQDVTEATYKLCFEYLSGHRKSLDSWNTWETIHRSFVQHGKTPSLLSKAYMHLIEMGSYPDSKGYANLMNNEEGTDKVLHLFKESKSMGVQPTTFMFEIVLQKLAKRKRYVEAQRLYKEMSVPKSLEIYSTMIRLSCGSNDIEFAEELFEEMLKQVDAPPNISVFNGLLDYFTHRTSNREKVKYYFDIIMQRPYVEPSSRTYRLLIESYTMVKPMQLEKADEVLKLMLQNGDGNKITGHHYAALIYARGVILKDFESANQFYRSLVYRGRVKPDTHIFQALIESYITCGKVRETSDVLQEMVKYHVEMDVFVGNLLIKGWGQVDPPKAIALFEHLEANHVTNQDSHDTVAKLRKDA